jgi:hypothetical protein
MKGGPAYVEVEQEKAIYYLPDGPNSRFGLSHARAEQGGSLIYHFPSRFGRRMLMFRVKFNLFNKRGIKGHISRSCTNH